MVFALTLALLMALLMVFFALENPTMVTVSLFGYAVQGSLALIVLVAMGVGVLIGLLVMLPGRIKSGLSNARSRKKIETLESSLEENRNRLAEMEKQVDPNSLPEYEKPDER